MGAFRVTRICNLGGMSDTAPQHAQLYETMLRRIRAGEWPAGKKVPSEKSLIAEFGVPRGPVRQALAALRADGIIYGGRGTPPRVQRTAPTQHFDIFRSFTEWANAIGLAPGQRVVGAGRRPASEQVAAELRVPPLSPVVEIIRLRLLDGKPAMLERSTFPTADGAHLLAADLETRSVHQILGGAGIWAARARHQIDATAATPLEVEMLGLHPGAPVLRVRRLCYDEFGTVIETADERYLPEMTNFVVENSAERQRADDAAERRSADAR